MNSEECRLRRSTPKRDYVLVEIEDPPTMSPGGILLLPPKDEERQFIGRVLAVGPGDWDARGRRIPMSVEVGDRLAISQFYIGRRVGKLVIFREPSTHYVVESVP